uniref:Transposable element P transposase n=1 Tax=Anopheles epiroticus TaxID=199890 RepID=A0A182PWN8_9DIPT
MLFDDMKQKHQISYLSTHKLNQDLLENFFSQLRQKGGTYDHPSPLNCLYRIRLMILGKSPSILNSVTTTIENKNTSQPDVFVTSTSSVENESDENLVSEEPYISASIFEEAEIVPLLDDVQPTDEEYYSSSAHNSSYNLSEQEHDGLEYIL